MGGRVIVVLSGLAVGSAAKVGVAVRCQRQVSAAGRAAKVRSVHGSTVPAQVGFSSGLDSVVVGFRFRFSSVRDYRRSGTVRCRSGLTAVSVDNRARS